MLEQVIVIGLAAWRVSSLLTSEDGPGKIFERFRQLIGAAEGEVKGLLPELFSCVWCLGLWAALGLWGIWELWRPEPVMVVAAAGVVIIVEKWVRDG
jgi:hypothetical protein